MSSIIFISGIHGVGKTTFCNEITKYLDCKHYSCSDLIKKNSSYVEISKKVTNVDHNQLVLQHALASITDSIYLLDGHFCLLDKEENVIQLDLALFKSIGPKVIVNINCNTEIIQKRLKSRDGNTLSISKLTEFQSAEKAMSSEAARTLGIPYIEYTSPEPVSKVASLLKQTIL
ncbi:ATP-binding protein [Shewanella atlantica]|uniref:ATP-binding protein n=1 Tax=Shewanella atlantica TaxID=271099 RepID=UPI0037358C5D